MSAFLRRALCRAICWIAATKLRTVLVADGGGLSKGFEEAGDARCGRDVSHPCSSFR